MDVGSLPVWRAGMYRMLIKDDQSCVAGHLAMLQIPVSADTRRVLRTNQSHTNRSPWNPRPLTAERGVCLEWCLPSSSS